MPTSSARYHHGDLRETLLGAAERMIDADVSRTFSLRELAREAEVSHAAPYKHFADRHQLIVALDERWMREFVAAQAAALGSSDPGQDLLALGSAYVGYAIAHPSRFLILFDPAINRPGHPPTPAFAELVREHATLLRDTVAAAAAAGVVSGRSETVGVALWSQVHGLATLVLLGYLPATDVKDVLTSVLHRGPSS